MKISQDFTKYLVRLCCFTLWIKTVASDPATKVWNKSSFSLKFNVPWPELLGANRKLHTIPVLVCDIYMK